MINIYNINLTSYRGIISDLLIYSYGMTLCYIILMHFYYISPNVILTATNLWRKKPSGVHSDNWAIYFKFLLVWKLIYIKLHAYCAALLWRRVLCLAVKKLTFILLAIIFLHTFILFHIFMGSIFIWNLAILLQTIRLRFSARVRCYTTRHYA